jgi:hypothetical protein
MMFSLPALILYGLAYNFLLRHLSSVSLVKLVSNIAFILLTVVSLWIFRNTIELSLLLSYSVVIIVFSLFFKIHLQKS